MPQILDTDTDTDQSAEQFVDVLCADEDLLRAEFDAIIAAEWPSPPPGGPDHEDGAGPDPRPAQRRSGPTSADLPNRPRHPGVGGWARPRSPPGRAAAQPNSARPEGR